MAWGTGNVGGGSSGGLNFKIIGGTSQPKNPVENTIWVNTTTKISEYYFGSGIPQGVVIPEGSVLIRNSPTPNNSSFNALKKNGILLNPASCFQKVNGQYIPKKAQIYKNGKWLNWDAVLYRNGDMNESLTGGWSGVGARVFTRPISTPYAPTVNFSSPKGIKMSEVSGQRNTGIVRVNNAIDLTPFRKLHYTIVSADVRSQYDNNLNSLRIFNGSATAENTVATGIINTTGEKIIDISSISGLKIIGFVLFNDEGTVELTVNNIWLEA